MSDYNRVIITGRLTRDPDVKFTPSGTPVCEFSMAVNGYKKKDATEADVSFIDCVAFKKLAETVGQHLRKGSQCLIEGQIKQERWETDQGQKRSRVKVLAGSVQFLWGKDEVKDETTEVADADIPF